MEISNPYWLRSGFIRKSHVQAARQYLEAKGAQSGNKKKKYASESEIAELAARAIYQVTIGFLHDARDFGRTMLYEGVGSILSPFISGKARSIAMVAPEMPPITSISTTSCTSTGDGSTMRDRSNTRF